MKRRWLAGFSVLLIVLVFALSSVAGAATADGLVYEVVDGEATVTGWQGTVDEDLVIPATLDGYPVTRIGKAAFSGCDNLVTVTLPDGVTEIGEQAFANNFFLRSVNIPDGVVSIGASAFAWSGLRSVTLPDSVKSIGPYAFYGCSITSVDIPQGVTVLKSMFLMDAAV